MQSPIVSASKVVGSFLLLAMVGCGSADSAAFGTDDPGQLDTGTTDEDTAVSDTSTGRDTSSNVDAPIGSDTKATPIDGSVPDGGPIPDVSVPDTAVPDTAMPDTAVPDSSVPDTAVKCTVSAARVFEGHCYFRIDARQFEEARTACRSFSVRTHLVSITSAGEQAFAETFGVGLERWIGLSKDFTDPAIPSSYEWVTGETSSYTNWGATEPNGSGSCVRLQTGNTWGDNDCFARLTAICEED